MDTKELIDELGKITAIRKRAEIAEDAIKKDIDKLELSDGTYTGDKYTLKVIIKQSIILNTEKLFKKLGLEKFLKVVKPVKKEVEKYMTTIDIDKCSSMGKESKAYSTDKIKEG